MNLKVNGISFDYPGNKVLENVSFEIKKGECLAVLGTNGAGKSTMLKCINRLLKPKTGVVYIDSINTKELSQKGLAKKIGYVSQKNSASRITVFDAILAGRRPHIKWDIKPQDYSVTQRVIKLLELEKFSLRYVDELSGGEYQKVVIARALVQEPDVLMLDEPTSSLDLKNQIEVIKLIKNVVVENNLVGMVTIHDLNLAFRFADKFILLKEGEIYAKGGIEIMTKENIKKVYSVDVDVGMIKNIPFIVPV